MDLTPDEISTLRGAAPLCPPELVGPDGYPDPRPLASGLPSPAYLWLAALVAEGLHCDPFVSVWTGAPGKAWGISEVGGPGAGLPRWPDLPSAGAFPQPPGRWTPELREFRVRALVRAVAQVALRDASPRP